MDHYAKNVWEKKAFIAGKFVSTWKLHNSTGNHNEHQNITNEQHASSTSGSSVFFGEIFSQEVPAGCAFRGVSAVGPTVSVVQPH